MFLCASGRRLIRDEVIRCKQSNQSYFPLALFILLYKVVLTFESVDEILNFDDSNERY